MRRLLCLIFGLTFCITAFAHTIEWYVDGTLYHTTTCASGDNITPPTPPAKTGYYFDSWIPDYIQLVYIQMPSRSYLLTDIVPTYDGRVEMDFQTTTVPSGAMTYVGGRTASHPAGLRFGTDSDKNWTVGAFGGAYVGVTNPSNNTRYKFVYNDQRISLTSNGTTIFNAKLTGTSATGAELAINALNNNGAITSYNEGIYLYSFKVWNGQGELVMDLVPAVQKGTVPVVGFYDTVSGTFKTATNGTFIAGPVAQ